MPNLALLATLALAFGGEPRPPDRIELKDGGAVEGYVLLERKDEVLVLVKSRERTIPADEIASVRSAARTLAEILDRLDALGPDDAAGRLELEATCRDRDLPGEAEVLALGALCVDPGHEAAHAFLGHAKRKAGWTVRRGAKSVPFDKLLAARADLRDPWKLGTTHYALLTNLALRDAVAMALDLERFYRAFYRRLGEEVELREVFTPLGVGVYGDHRTFPEGLARRPAYFDPASGQVLVNAAAVDPRRALVHEATHQILHATAVATRRGLGEIPGWLDEGLAEYMAWSLAGGPGRVTFDLGAFADHHFEAHREAKKPYDLGRVLQFASGDFHGSSKTDLKYAEAYTLVHFLLHGEEGGYREEFFAFLRGAYEGRASSTDFKKAFEASEKELEEAWNRHVRRPVR